MSRGWLTIGVAVVLAVAGLAALQRGVIAADAKDKAALPPYVHSVIFTLKKDAPADEVDKLLADCHDLLGKISTVRHLWAGRPSPKGTPKVARTDYQIGLVILFDDADGLQKYLDDPEHLKFVDRHGKYFDMEKLAVYDFATQAK